MASTYVTDATGTFIPATQRPDGSWRKARRIKEGYVPQEEVPLYESKGKQWAKGRSEYPVGLDLNHVAAPDPQPARTPGCIPGLSLDNVETNKKSKKKKKKKPKSDSDPAQTEDVTEDVKELSLSGPAEEDCTAKGLHSDPAKKLKSLRKKLREIEVLEKKIQSGELANPEKDQFEKISRKDEVLDQIEDLEMEIGKNS